MTILSPALLLVLNASGAFVQSATAPKNSSLSLTPRVKIALSTRMETLKGANINVDTNATSHTVTLTGTVRSRAQKTLAGDIARHQAGTFQVQNRLLVTDEQIVSQPGVPAKYARTVHFLQLLAQSQGRSDGTTFRVRKTRFPDVKRVVSFTSKLGVTIVDANENGGEPLFLSRARLERDLKRTGSTAFDSLAYVGYIFAMTYTQYSSLTFKTTRDGILIEMPSGHRLTWERERGRLQLRKLEYLKIGGN